MALLGPHKPTIKTAPLLVVIVPGSGELVGAWGDGWTEDGLGGVSPGLGEQSRGEVL